VALLSVGYCTHFWLVFMVATVLVSGCYGTRFWLFKYLFLVVMVAAVFYSPFFGCYRIISCCCFVTVLISGCYSTLFWF
jgi:hypothetical protein